MCKETLWGDRDLKRRKRPYEPCICVKRPYEEKETLKGERDPTNPV